MRAEAERLLFIDKKQRDTQIFDSSAASDQLVLGCRVEAEEVQIQVAKNCLRRPYCKERYGKCRTFTLGGVPWRPTQTYGYSDGSADQRKPIESAVAGVRT